MATSPCCLGPCPCTNNCHGNTRDATLDRLSVRRAAEIQLRRPHLPARMIFTSIFNLILVFLPSGLVRSALLEMLANVYINVIVRLTPKMQA